MEWVNAVMTITGYIWWGVIGAGLVAYIVIVGWQWFTGEKKDLESTFYYEHDYDKTIGKVVKLDQDKDGISAKISLFDNDERQ